jgi:hypothetical protein
MSANRRLILKIGAVLKNIISYHVYADWDLPFQHRRVTKRGLRHSLRGVRIEVGVIRRSFPPPRGRRNAIHLPSRNRVYSGTFL